VSPPAKRVRDYHERVHVPRPLMAALAIAALLQLAIAAAAFALRRPPPPRRREVFLLAGAALAMLFGTAATSEFVLRYLIPVVPLLVCGGVAAAADLAALAARVVPLPLRGRTGERTQPAVS
jgi:CHASE2 domain-containing sensor protein